MKAFALVLAAMLSAGVSAAPGDAPPPSYECFRTSGPIQVDGRLDDATWERAPWTADFIDIEGGHKPRPRLRTRAKMLWDDHYLYIAAELEEPDVKATLTQRDSAIFKDNNFEVFLKPLPETDSYYELEINALNTGWDLFMPKPYSQGGKADNSWDIEGLKTAVAVQGSLNKPGDRDHGWTVEIAIPLTAFASRQAVPHPGAGAVWRINFGRMEWAAEKVREGIWVWSAQGVVNMHVPERWGVLRFSDRTWRD
ncbi:carbohydrate-binding family 9-like protein [Massilia endophytica]|uniref:carbohydrate-binding family 9-like protein n=1 Tax=Massilia endophytica TaxID=2899220 RepID=UPI001E468CA8|nr:carbohydrate-binding family 9-like protein [Massilia endophytica]UGQ47307.1 carbohydrate-binding family 9-like protein [Massilia endophytica]